jgi:hypothetical protein
MPQTLRKTFSNRSHTQFKPTVRKGFESPLSLEGFMQQLQAYIDTAKSDLLQPRQNVIDRILLEAAGI